MPRLAPPGALLSRKIQQEKAAFFAREQQVNKENSTKWLDAMGLKNGAKASTKKVTKSTKATKKTTQQQPIDQDKEEEEPIDDGTEPTAENSSYQSSADEDSVGEEEEVIADQGDDRSTMSQIETRRSKKRKQSDGDNDTAATIAHLQKQLEELTKANNKAARKKTKAATSQKTAAAKVGEETYNEEEDNKQATILVRRLSKEEAAQQRNKEIGRLVRGAVKSKVWRSQKFVKSEKHLDKLTTAVMDILAIPWTTLKGLKPDTYEYNQVLIRRDNFVAIYREDVRKEINEKRSYTMGQGTNAVEAWMNGTYDGSEKFCDLPTEEEMYKVVMRDLEVTDLDTAEANQEATERNLFVFRWYVCEYLPCYALNEVFGTKYHDWGPVSYLELEDSTPEKVKERVPPSTEAFALSCYESNREKWKNVYDFKQDPNNKDKKKPRYEKNQNPDSHIYKGKYTDPNSGQARFGGWTEDGLKRFYKLCKKIEDNRIQNKDRVRKFDQLVVDKITEEKTANGDETGPKRKKKGAKTNKPIEGEDYEEEI